MTDQRERMPANHGDTAEELDTADSENPDRDNAEQDETGTQAQDLAQEALHRGDRPRESDGSSHGGKSDPTELIPDDTQDLVDHMTDMVSSGRIDMDAFEGEPESMDDEDGSIPE